MLMTILLVILLFGLMYWFGYIIGKELPWLSDNKPYITLTKTGGISGMNYKILYKDMQYKIFNRGKLVKSGTLYRNLKRDIDEMKYYNPDMNYEIRDGIFGKLTIDNMEYTIDYQQPLPKLVRMLDDLLKN